jgi:hypothetical protein
MRLVLVEAFDGFNGFLPSSLPAMAIIVNHCGLESLLIQVRSECATLCIGELTRELCGFRLPL